MQRTFSSPLHFYFNSDILLLSLLILIEAYEDGKNIIALETFIKEDLETNSEITDEIHDTNDFLDINDYFLQYIQRIIEDLELVNITAEQETKIYIPNTEEAIEDIIRKAIKEGDTQQHAIEYLRQVLDEAYAIKEAQQEEAQTRTGYDKFAKDITFPLNKLEIVHTFLPSSIFIVINFDEDDPKETKELITNLKKELKKFIYEFANDAFIERSPEYQFYRDPFITQLNTFQEYANQLSVINHHVIIPFSALASKEFELIKILKYLEYEEKIEIKSWQNTQNIEVKLLSDSLGIQDTLTKYPATHLKMNLSFDEAKGKLFLTEENSIEVKKGSDQFHLLRILFQNPSNLSEEVFYSEIAEEVDFVADFNDKKFYNAAYQIKQKIIKETGITDLLLTNSQSVRINPDYL